MNPFTFRRALRPALSNPVGTAPWRPTGRRDVQRLLRGIPREVTVVMIEHNMDVALEFAERITLLHFGEVIVEGTRAEVIADPRTREVYLGH